MLEHIRDLFFILLSVAGMIYIWKSIFILILKNKNDRRVYVVVPIDDTIENVEQIVRSTAERTILMGNSKWTTVVCVDYGSNSETKEIIERLCTEYSFLDYMDTNTFNGIFIKDKKKEHTV